MFRFTAVYPATEGGRFDFDYYVKNHMPMCVSFIGESVMRTEVTRGVSGAEGSPAPYAATGSIYLRNLDGLQIAVQQHGAKMGDDVPNFTNIAPVLSIEEIVAG